MSMGEFLERYGEHTAIAALAVIVEDEELDKKRIIHDATHGVRVNHRVKCRDKLRFSWCPGEEAPAKGTRGGGRDRLLRRGGHR